ncbi:MAG: hypothetical protein KIT84_42920 [Labilithrix sp.]|nr:hypothetical protein [Labilithrix sp.]MCW5817832.1 hypothetical protein [Labilithrix sp.]
MGRLFLCGVVTVIGLAACGGKKEEAKDPSDEKSSVGDETPKWDSSSSTVAQQAEDKNRPPRPAGGIAPNEQPSRRTDQYDKEGTEVALKRAARQVKDNCGQAKDENGKAVGPWGNVTIQVMLGSNGRSKGVTVPQPYAGKPVGTCIERSFTGLQFPPWAGSDTQVDWEVELVEPGKEGKK